MLFSKRIMRNKPNDKMHLKLKFVFINLKNKLFKTVLNNRIHMYFNWYRLRIIIANYML